MMFEELWGILRDEISHRIKTKKALEIFAKKRAKFEGWLKVEVCDVLMNYGEVKPEKERVDIQFDNYLIELKTINTSYRVDGIENKTKPISKNIKSVLEDIEKLKKLKCSGVVFFIVFPLNNEKEKLFEYHIQKIREKSELREAKFYFSNGLEGKIYMGLVK